MNLALMIPGREQCPHFLQMLTEFTGICFWKKFWRLMDMGFGTITYLWDHNQVNQALSGGFILSLSLFFNWRNFKMWLDSSTFSEKSESDCEPEHKDASLMLGKCSHFY